MSGERRFGGDGGSASIVACCVMAALLVVTGTLVHVGSVVVTRHRVQAGADLAALAVAAALDRGSSAACERAEEVATRMRMRVRTCRIEGWDAVVEMGAVSSHVVGGKEARAVARAGPAGARAGPAGARAGPAG